MQGTQIYNTQLKTSHFLRKELLHFYGFIFLNVIVVYFLPQVINQLFFLTTLFFFWKSKKNYFWFAFLLFITFAPGGLFQGGELAGIKAIASYNITSGVTFNYFDLFVPIAFIKALKGKQKIHFNFSKEFKPLFFLAILTMVITIIVGIEIKVFINIIRFWLPFTFIFSIPRLFKSKEEFYLLLYLILPTAFLIIFLQITLALFDYNVMALLTGNVKYNEIYEAIDSTGTAIRATNFFTENLLLNIIFSLTMILTRKRLFSKKYLQIIVIVTSISIIISATRLWMFTLFFGVVYYLIFIIKKKMNFIVQGLLVVMIFFTFILTYPPLNQLVEASFGRFLTLEKIAEVGAQADGSANMRINVRLPYSLAKIARSPYFGWGFTHEFTLIPQEKNGKQVTWIMGDYHVGNFNILANVGFVGFLFFVVFWIRVIRKFLIQKRKALPIYKKTIHGLLMFFYVFLLAHFTTYQFFGFTQTIHQNYFMVIYFMLASIVFYENRLEKEKRLKKIKIV